MCKEMSGFCDMSSSGAELLEQALSQADQYGTPARSQAQQPPRRVLRSNAQQLQDSPQILIPPSQPSQPSQPSLLSLQLQPSPPATVTVPPCIPGLSNVPAGSPRRPPIRRGRGRMTARVSATTVNGRERESKAEGEGEGKGEAECEGKAAAEQEDHNNTALLSFVPPQTNQSFT